MTVTFRDWVQDIDTGASESGRSPALADSARAYAHHMSTGDGLRGGQATGGRLLTPRGLRTRAKLVDAARQVFEEISFREARLTDITAAAGVAAGTFYTYFDSKEAIFREVADEVLLELSNAARRDPDNAEGDAVGDIAHASRQYFLACLRNAGVVRSMEQLAVSDEGINKARRNTVRVGVKRVERWIRRLQERGICDQELDPRTTAIALHTMNVRVAYDHLLPSGDRGDVEPLVAAVTRVWARTVGLEQPTRDPSLLLDG
jgi:AcrR family transcriptional regulator